MILIFGNNNQTTLAAPINNIATTLTVFPGDGTAFPHPGADQYFVLTLTDAATGLINEIVWVTDVTGDTFTIQRAKEGTTAQSWLAGDYTSCFPTAGSQASFVQADQLQLGTYSFAVATGTANALVATIPSNRLTIPDGMSLVIKSAFANTGVTTLNLTLGSIILGAFPIVKSGNQPLITGDIPITGYPITLNWSATFGAWVMQNPATGISTIPAGTIFYFPCNTPPAGYLLANGQLVSRTAFANLWAFAQTSGNIVTDATWGSGFNGSFSFGDGSTNFRLPQLGGYFLRSLDNGNGIDPGRVMPTSIQAGQNVNHAHLATSNSVSNSVSNSTSNSIVNDPGHAHSIPVRQRFGSNGAGVSDSDSTITNHAATNSAATNISVSTSTITTTGTSTSTTTAIAADGGSEARPINIAILTCIKY